MKASEIMKRYATGKMNFQNVSLRGQTFKGQNLLGADFSGADIRGTDFTNAMLQGTNFRGAKAGLQSYWLVALVICSWLLSGLSGIVSGLAVFFVSLLFDTSSLENNSLVGLTILIVLAGFFVVTVRQGLVVALVFVAVAGVVAGSVAGAFAVAKSVAGAVAGAFAVAGAVAGVVAGSIAGSVAVAVAGTIAVTIAVTVAVAGAAAGTVAVALAGSVAGAVAGSVLVTLFSVYIGFRALAGDEKHAWIRWIAIALAATGGTSFRGADLTDADFTNATLKSTDLRRAILTRTLWCQAKKLDRVRPGVTYLRNTQLQIVLITGQGQGKNFDRQDLRGINLQGAKLADASFIGADLSEANLQDADLSRAKLVQTQLDETDLTGATLTGAYIEDWGITSHTKLDEVRCEYVFMRLPTKEDLNARRKPDNWEEKFEDGDFADFIKPMVDTLDLYHNQSVDPRAIAISFKQLAENNPDAELRIVGMEVRGEDKFLLRSKTAPDADRSALSAEYFDIYNQLKALAEQEIQAQIAEKNIRIRSLETMVVTALQHPSFYTETYYNQSDIMSKVGSRIINISSVSGIAGDNLSGITLDNLSSAVTNTINQLPASPEPDKPGLKELLAQLQAAIEADTDLTSEDKVQALEQVKTLAELARTPASGDVKKPANIAIKLLRGVSDELSNTSKLVEEFEQLLPAIIRLLGL